MPNKNYTIVFDDVPLDNIISQVRLIKNFPCFVSIYDRIFKLTNEETKYGLIHGLEVGWFLSEEFHNIPA